MSDDFAKFNEELLRRIANSLNLTYEEYVYEGRVTDLSNAEARCLAHYEASLRDRR